MVGQYFAKIEEINGNATEPGFEHYFEASYVDGGDIKRFTNDSPPLVTNVKMSLKNVPESVGCVLMKSMLDGRILKEVTVSRADHINGKLTVTSSTQYTQAVIVAAQLDTASATLDMELGSFASIEATHYRIDGDGKVTPFRTKYDLTKWAVN